MNQPKSEWAKEKPSDAALRQRVFKVFAKILGPADFVRFLQTLSPRAGDFTKERRKWIDKMTLDDILKETRNAKDRRAS